MPPRRETALQRFFSKVQQDANGCWMWTDAPDRDGYGHFHADRKVHIAHRWAYEQFVGAIPEGLVLDHLCRTPSCVNPGHLEAVTSVENVMRGNGPSAINARRQHCVKGHVFDERNTRIGRQGRRECRECARLWQIDYRKRKREQGAAA